MRQQPPASREEWDDPLISGSAWVSELVEIEVLNGGQVIVDDLIREKVPYAFGLCGHGNIGFIDALYERADEIKTIDRDRGTPRGATPPPPPGIRVRTAAVRLG